MQRVQYDLIRDNIQYILLHDSHQSPIAMPMPPAAHTAPLPGSCALASLSMYGVVDLLQLRQQHTRKPTTGAQRMSKAPNSPPDPLLVFASQNPTTTSTITATHTWPSNPLPPSGSPGYATDIICATGVPGRATRKPPRLPGTRAARLIDERRDWPTVSHVPPYVLPSCELPLNSTILCPWIPPPTTLVWYCFVNSECGDAFPGQRHAARKSRTYPLLRMVPGVAEPSTVNAPLWSVPLPSNVPSALSFRRRSMSNRLLPFPCQQCPAHFSGSSSPAPIFCPSSAFLLLHHLISVTILQCG